VLLETVPCEVVTFELLPEPPLLLDGLDETARGKAVTVFHVPSVLELL